MVVQGGAPADGVPFSANVPRPSGSSFISLRKAPRQRVRCLERWLIERNKRSAQWAQGAGCSPQRNKGGAEGGGHSRRGVPGALCTRPEQERQMRPQTKIQTACLCR